MTMPDTNMTANTTAATRPSRAVPIMLGLIAALLVATTFLLWAHYGTAVFIEIIQAGFAACFG